MLRACKVFTSEIASEYACDWQCRERLEGDGSDSICSTRHILPGTEDQIVPPNQTEKIVDATGAKGLPVGYLLFAGEQQGSRKTENISHALDA